MEEEVEEGGRRTRSGRKSIQTVIASPTTRSTRRLKKSQEEISDYGNDEVAKLTAELIQISEEKEDELALTNISYQENPKIGEDNEIILVDQHNQNMTENITEELITTTEEMVESSFLESLVGDNANSLPGEEVQTNFIEIIDDKESDTDVHLENIITEESPKNILIEQELTEICTTVITEDRYQSEPLSIQNPIMTNNELRSINDITAESILTEVEYASVSSKRKVKEVNDVDMARVTDNIIVLDKKSKIDESGGIRTRSGNKTTSGHAITRTTRRKKSQDKFVESEDEDQIMKSITEIVSDEKIEMEVIEEIPEDEMTKPTVAEENEIVLNELHQQNQNSTSFPFGDLQQSENSVENKSEELNIINEEIVDISLLASLAGENANSLPGEESQTNFEEIVTTETIDEDTNSENAIAEDIPNGENSQDKTINQIDAEIISEDELQPTSPIEKPQVNDAEEVSDDELPAPKRAELPADTENVSEDELPSTGGSPKKSVSKNKRKAEKGSDEYNPGSPTGENSNEAAPEKKAKVEEDEKDKKKEKKKLPELDKYWKTVRDDPSDFTGWTYLLQYVDQETDIEAAREAYDAFLSHYPYCYGYWRKYADYEKKKSVDHEKCREVFERGLKAIPLSVDLWIHYLGYIKATKSDNEEYTRSQFLRAVDACGLEFRSDKLWEAFIKWEMEGKRYAQIVKIYDRLLGLPTQGYNGHFDSFQDLISNHPAPITVGIEEFKKLRSEVREVTSKSKRDKKDPANDADTAPGVDINEDEADDHVTNEEEMNSIKDKIISSRRKLHKQTVAAVTARWSFEEGIKRPYFHVKPLERSQLKNWNEYLDFEIEKGDQSRVLILFERCLIACALYDEFWLKLIRYLESLIQQTKETKPELIELTRDAYTRACKIHHPDKPNLHLMWSAFEECELNYDKAAEVLVNVEKNCPTLLQISYRRINLERRRGDYKKCEELYEYYVKNAKNKNISGNLSIKYARFLNKIQKNITKGLSVLKDALEKDPSNTRVALQWIDLALQRDNVNEKEIVDIMDKFMSRENIDPDQKVLFAQRKVEFLEDFGSSARGLQDAQKALQNALSKANEAKKKNETSPTKANQKVSASHPPSTAVYNNNNTYYGPQPAQQTYYNSGQQQSYQSYDSYGYGYGSGYNYGSQWGGGGNSYGNYY